MEILKTRRNNILGTKKPDVWTKDSTRDYLIALRDTWLVYAVEGVIQGSVDTIILDAFVLRHRFLI